MDSLSINIFKQARLVVAQAEREMAEVGDRFDAAFPLSREEKDELRPTPVDVFDQWSIELSPKNAGATFLMTPEDGGAWTLDVVEGGRDQSQQLGRFHAGNGSSGTRGRLRAARVVNAIGSWLEAKGKLPSPDMETVLVFEANARVEVKQESRPRVQPPPQQQHHFEGNAPPVIQPRWLDMLPGAQEVVPESALAVAASNESRTQTTRHLGKIFGF
jgi:glycine/D-amino acid oxidase-like deaminating enzyme